jgi:hypothetical protein
MPVVEKLLELKKGLCALVSLPDDSPYVHMRMPSADKKGSFLNVPIDEIIEGNKGPIPVWRGAKADLLNPAKADQSHVLVIVDGIMVFTPMRRESTFVQGSDGTWTDSVTKKPADFAGWRVPLDMFLVAAGLKKPMAIQIPSDKLSGARAQNFKDILAEQKAYAIRAAATAEKIAAFRKANGIEVPKPKPSAKDADQSK